MAPRLVPRTVYVGTFVHLACRTELCVRENAVVGVDPCGRIEFILEKDGRGESAGEVTDEWIEAEVQKHGWGRPGLEEGCEDVEGADAAGKRKGWVLIRAGKGEWWFPGFVGEFRVFCFFDLV